MEALLPLYIIFVCCVTVVGMLVTKFDGYTTYGDYINHKLIGKRKQIPQSSDHTSRIKAWGIRFAVNPIMEMTVGEFLVLLFYFSTLNLTFLLCLYDSFISSNYQLFFKNGITLSGKLISINLTLLFIPVTHNSILTLIFGVSYERALKFHRIFSRTTVFIIFVHFMFIFTNEYYFKDFNLNQFTSEILFNFSLRGQGNGFGFLAFILALTVLFFALEYIRRNYFKIFRFTHYLYIFIFIFSLLHDSTFLPWLFTVPLLLFTTDYAVRVYKKKKFPSLEIVEMIPNDDLLELKIKMSRDLVYPPGDGCFFNIDLISWFEWHPFSLIQPYCISSASQPQHLHFLIKNMGPNTWTGKLYQLSTQLSPQELSKHITLDGPYGNLSIKPENYSVLLIVCAGIGVTPPGCVLQDIFEKEMNWRKYGSQKKSINKIKVKFVWIVRDVNYLKYYKDLLAKIHKKSSIFKIKIFITNTDKSKDKDICTDYPGQIFYRRPKLDKMFKALKTKYNNEKTGVICCGPPSLVTDVQALAHTHDFHFHREVYHL